MVLLSLGGLPFADFRNEYQMTLLVIDHEFRFKALPPSVLKKKTETNNAGNLLFSFLALTLVW